MIQQPLMLLQNFRTRPLQLRVLLVKNRKDLLVREFLPVHKTRQQVVPKTLLYPYVIILLLLRVTNFRHIKYYLHQVLAYDRMFGPFVDLL